MPMTAPLARWSMAVLAVLLLAIAQPAAAQWGARKQVVTATARIEPAEALRGAIVEVIVSATVDPAYHLYAMKQPVPGGGPVATEINLSEATAKLLTPVGEWKEPESKVKVDPGFEIDVALLYGSPLEFRRSYRVNTDAAVGDVELALEMYYQACTETSCLPPATAAIAAALKVLPGEPVAAPAAAVKVAAPPVQSVSEAAVSGGGSFGGFLLASFLFGLVALATPCVFPMIPITISFFTNKAAKSTGQAAKYAAVYVGSIILGFTLIGFGFSLLLLLLGAGVERSGFAQWIASNPWVNLFFALLYITFALSLFEVLHLQAPQFLTGKLGKQAGTRNDFLGIAAKAMVFVLISFTCTAPLLGVLIVQTLTGGDWTRPLFGMMAFATGFALPFFVLALLPQMLGSLPKSGSWLYATKVVMGLVVLAAAFKFLSNADIVWLKENLILTREVLLALWAAIATATALYLFGLIRLKDEGASDGIGVPRMLGGVTFGFVALYLAGGLFGGKLHGWLEAYMPIDFAPPSASAAAKGDTLTWHEEVEPAIAEARATGKNVFIDFTGYTCTNCRLMEKNMFPRPEIHDLLGKYVRVKLYTDDRKKGAERQEFQARHFNTVALPYYAVVTPDMEVLGKAEYSTDAVAFATFLKSGL